MKTVEVLLWLDAGCSKEEGEYSTHLKSFSEPLEMGYMHGQDDISLIMECIENDIDDIDLPYETLVCVTLTESGEREDVFWHKYYVISNVYCTS